MKQHNGNAMIVVTCTSPNGVRKIKYTYHFDDRADDVLQHADAAVNRAAARGASYKLQGWSVQIATQTVLSPRARRALRRRRCSYPRANS